VEHRVPQTVGKDLAKQATIAAFDAHAERLARYRPRAEWIGDYKALVSVQVSGMALSGTVEFHEREVGLAMDVPLLLRPLRSRVIERIERELALWFARAQAGTIGLAAATE
jgi:hypothetical protein